MNTQQDPRKTYAGPPPQNYERYFVPAIGAPLADDLVEAAALQAGERVLDVACGTGVVARLAASQVGPTGSVTGLDVNSGMLAAARAAAPSDLSIEWHEASAEDMPLPDRGFDAVLCQMGLQFIPDKSAALSEMRRVLVENGRAALNFTGPAPDMFARLADALGEHVGAEAAGFVNTVFSLHDEAVIGELMEGAGFRNITTEAATRSLPLPPPADFLWQYIFSTPLAGAVGQAASDALASLERDVVSRWQAFVDDGGMLLDARIVTVVGRRKGYDGSRRPGAADWTD